MSSPRREAPAGETLGQEPLVTADYHDVTIVGAGLAGLSLARQLLLETDKTVLLLERREQVPPQRQKVGEATVQLSAYYFAKVLGMEPHLVTDHYMKYNLRFLWPSAEPENDGSANDALEDYSQAYIRNLSNIASYQIDRNKFESELLRLNKESDRFTYVPGVRELDIELRDRARHEVRFRAAGHRHEVSARWVVDTSGRNKVLARKLDLGKPNPIRHGAFFWWVDGLLDIEELTELSPRERRLHPSRRETGHLPFFLATNHFMTEGAWFWVIPLHGRTSLGLVFDREIVDPDDVMSVEKATRWVCERFPLFARELPNREAVSFGGLKDFSHDCRRTLSPQRWAVAGEAGRFSDPLYSPGGDLIAIYNTLIVDAVETDDDAELIAKCDRYEQLMRSVYSAYEPSYSLSYDALGDAEVFSLKYGWELAVYFSFYVFPFINDLFTDRRFQPAFLRLFARLGPINHGLQRLLSGYYQWKKAEKKETRVGGRGNGRQPAVTGEPSFFEFTRLCTLRRSEKTFYEVGIGATEAKAVLAERFRDLEEMARYVTAWIAAHVLEEPELLHRRAFVESLDLARLEFDPEGWRQLREASRGCSDPYPWSLDPEAMRPFRSATPAALRAMSA
jgi:flavin-dependent dehydrogenase